MKCMRRSRTLGLLILQQLGIHDVRNVGSVSVTNGPHSGNDTAISSKASFPQPSGLPLPQGSHRPLPSDTTIRTQSRHEGACARRYQRARDYHPQAQKRSWLELPTSGRHDMQSEPSQTFPFLQGPGKSFLMHRRQRQHRPSSLRSVAQACDFSFNIGKWYLTRGCRLVDRKYPRMTSFMHSCMQSL